MGRTLRLILGDQLNSQHSWFGRIDPNVTYVMMEVLPETAYVTHHIQKVVGFFVAMRNFASEMEKKGHQFIYFRLDDPHNRQSFEANVSDLLESGNFLRFEYLLPDEYRLDQLLSKFAARLSIPTAVYDTEHFMGTRDEVQRFFKDRKTFVMEAFYRHIRTKYNLLMSDGKPLGGSWNFDVENRKSLSQNVVVPTPPEFQHNVTGLVEMLNKMKVKTIGSIDAPKFPWPVSRKQSLEWLEF